MTQLLADLRRSLRVLLNERTFSATVLLTLALCLGANVAIYSVVHAVLLEPLPFEEPDRLVVVSNAYPAAGVPRAANGVVDFFERRENVAAFAEVAIYQGGGNTIGESGSTERVTSLRVSPSFFPLLGVQAALGRTFLEEEMEVGNHLKVVLTHAAWQEYYGGSADAVGRDMRIDGRPYTVVGVLDEDFVMPDRADVRLYLPLAFEPEARRLDNWHSNSFQMLARLAPGASAEQALAQNLALNDALIDQWNQPNARQLLTDAGYTTIVVPAADDMVRDIRPVLYMLWAGVAFVLLIGCVNIANLMLARAQTRLTDVATRLALGASRSRVAGAVFTESIVLSVLGGVLGLAVGAAGLLWLERVGATDLPRGTEIGIDIPVVLFALGLAVATGAIFGAIPMASVMRGDLSPVFRGGGRTGTASRRAVAVRSGLVVSQVGLAFVMLVGAGLMLASFRSALSVDPGFEPEGVLTGFLSLPSARYEDGDARRRFWDELLAEVRSLPGVAAASVTTQLPFTGESSASLILPEGYVLAPGESLLAPFQTIAGPGYFEALGVEVLQGRAFQESDEPGVPRVVIIDEWLANRYWPEGGAVGDRMVFGVVPGTDSIPDESLYTVVGIVETVKQNDLTTPASEHVGAYYFTYRQQPPAFVTLTVRTTTEDAPAVTPEIRSTLARLDAELPFFGVETMEARIDESLTRRRVPLVLLGVFAAVALFLAVVGIYGALAYNVSQRTREIGIRMAMGSDPGDVFRGVVARGLGVTAAGLVLGGAAAYFLTRLIESLLFGVAATDVRVIAGVALLLAAVAAAACTIPARRATRVNPVEALGG
jgi:predicted permease